MMKAGAEVTYDNKAEYNKLKGPAATTGPVKKNCTVNYSNSISQQAKNVKPISKVYIKYLDEAIDNIAKNFFYSTHYGFGVSANNGKGYEWRMLPFEDKTSLQIAKMLTTGQYVIGAVPEDEDGTTSFIAFDMDGKYANTKLHSLTDVLHGKGIPFFVSHSGKKGYHLFISFETSENISDAIAYENYLLTQAGLVSTVGNRTYERKSVELRPRSKGKSIIKLPMSLHLDGIHHEVLMNSNTFQPLTNEQTINFFANVLPYKQVCSLPNYKEVSISTNKSSSIKGDLYTRYKRIRKAFKKKKGISADTTLLPSVDKQTITAAMKDIYLSTFSHVSAETLLAWLHRIAESENEFDDVRQIAYDADIMIKLFKLHGVNVPDVAGKSFKCPFHKDNHPSASIMPSRETGIVHFNDWHGKGKKLSYNISDIHASLTIRRLVNISNNKQEMFRHLVFAALETGSVTGDAKIAAQHMLKAYEELKTRKGIRKHILLNSLKVMVLVTLQAYTGSMMMLSARYLAKIINEKHSAATKLLKYLAVIGILRVSQSTAGDSKVDIYMANPLFIDGMVSERLRKLAQHNALNISRLTQVKVAQLFSLKYALRIYYRITAEMEEFAKAIFASVGQAFDAISLLLSRKMIDTTHDINASVVPIHGKTGLLSKYIVGSPNFNDGAVASG